MFLLVGYMDCDRLRYAIMHYGEVPEPIDTLHPGHYVTFLLKRCDVDRTIGRIIEMSLTRNGLIRQLPLIKHRHEHCQADLKYESLSTVIFDHPNDVLETSLSTRNGNWITSACGFIHGVEEVEFTAVGYWPPSSTTDGSPLQLVSAQTMPNQVYVVYPDSMPNASSNVSDSENELIIDMDVNTSTSTVFADHQPSVIKSNPNASAAAMSVFDQQTQTNVPLNLVTVEKRLGQMADDSDKILQKLRMIGESNHSLAQRTLAMAAEWEQIRRVFTDIARRIVPSSVSAGRSSTNSKHDRNTLSRSTPPLLTSSTPQAAKTPVILNLSHRPNYTPQTFARPSAGGSGSPSIMDQSMASNDSFMDHSAASLADSYSSKTSESSIGSCTSGGGKMKRPSAAKAKRTAKPKNPVVRPEDVDHSEDWWYDESADPNEELVIGSNGSKCERNVLMTINWSSHTAATRRLLRSLFPREVLASHSLTGKPSPGKTHIHTHSFIRFEQLMVSHWTSECNSNGLQKPIRGPKPPARC